MSRQWVPSVGDYVENRRTEKIGRVIEVNEKWGWFKVKYEERAFVYEYRLYKGKLAVRYVSMVELADRRLRQETLGLTDSWRE